MNDVMAGLLKTHGLYPLKSRQDIDTLVELLVGRMGL